MDNFPSRVSQFEEQFGPELNYTECRAKCVGHGNQYCGNDDHVLLYEECKYRCSEIGSVCDLCIRNELKSLLCR